MTHELTDQTNMAEELKTLKVKQIGQPEHAKTPARMSGGAAGFDFYAEEIIHEDSRSIWYRTGFAVNIPNDTFGDLRARGSVSKRGLFLANGAGVLDPDFHGEVQFRFYKVKPDINLYRDNRRGSDRTDSYGERYKRRVNVYQPGDRIGQMVIVPQLTTSYDGVQLVSSFDETTERGEGAFGSTGQR